ncbi:peptidase S28 [Sistotremastrum suecicum HHB10207 ss-3]|uniref:Peptidase S28 n=1 Tax=Sistotremastrum suecicum HHB10207 ss-3 TaxID=1314776 RepID=A0A166J6Z7_9AGAM|nr:peptidase S28 [Sistotremastrum suecicum HHB10207 ss-3]
MHWTYAFLYILAFTGEGYANIPVQLHGPTAIKLWNLEVAAAERSARNTPSLNVQTSPRLELSKAHKSVGKVGWFRQPLDHFSDSGHTFLQRYWYSDKHYKTGGPVIVLDGGETSGANRLPFLDTGIVEILANATGGLGVILEHRYYGQSIPVQNFSTDSLRWLDNAQSAADSANFMANIKFSDELDNLTAPGTPWIYYGGSYAGARAAHMKILYPDLVFGAIASSAVTHAQIDYWEYLDLIRTAAPKDCSDHLVNSIKLVDFALAHPHLRGPIKKLFGLEGLKNDEDFGSLLEAPLSSWQAQVWDPEVGSTAFDNFCKYLNKEPWNKGLMAEVSSIFAGQSVDLSIINYAAYIRERIVSQCPEDKTVEECFGTGNKRDFEDDSLKAKWRPWTFQVCTEWGYFIGAPPDPERPRIISRVVTTEWLHSVCAKAFPDGKDMSIPTWPNVTSVNSLGDFDLAADKLAFIDGDIDPWRPATPHSDYAHDRRDTIQRPFKLIPNAVHHYDEYGLRNIEDEPAEILKIHLEMVHFVKEWLKDWEA